MTKVLAYILVIIVVTSVFLYKNNQKEQIEILKQKQEEELLVKSLERFYLAGKVECYNHSECNIDNGVSKYFQFSNLYLRNRQDLITFFKLLDKDSKDYRAEFIKKNNFEYYLSDGSFFNNPINNIDNSHKEFEIGIKKLRFKNNILDDFAFLTWYVDISSYQTIIDTFKNINVSLKTKYEIKNSHLSFDKLDLELKLTLVDESKIKLMIKNKKIELKIENYDSLKIIFVEFKEIIKKFLENNKDIIFFSDLLTHYDDIVNPKVKSISLSTNNLFDTKNILFVSTYKLESN